MSRSQAIDYRQRLYDRYVSSREGSLAPQSVAGFKSRKPYLTRLIQRHFPAERDATILDLGCGHGSLIYFARLAGYGNATGVDTSSEQVAEAKRLGIEGVVLGDAMETLRSLPDASQDVVIALDVVEHLTKDEVLCFADEVLRTLKPGGRWIIHAPNAASPLFGTIRYGDYTHEQAFTSRSMTQMLLTVGFGRVECFEDEPIPHGLKSFVRLCLWKLIRAGLTSYLLVETGTAFDAIFTFGFLTVTIK
jgi:2-polyprenyl-3-methyl-5-hydroxy-6-metoxy-1,4-benzoquinol methylase